LALAGLAGALAAATAVPAAAQDAPAPTPAPAPADAPTAVPTTIPQGCTAALPLAAQFVGKVTSGDDAVVRYTVTELRAGTVPGPDVDVDYSGNDDRRFIDIGHTYLVAAAVDPESQRLVSKVRQPREEPAACAPFDPIYTRHVDGTALDTSLLAGMKGRWAEVGTAFLIPAGSIFAVLLGLVILKHSLLLTGRGVRYARSRHRSRPSAPPGRAPRAGAPRPASRTRTHTAPPSPG
jgi:hypothetical protein